MGLKKAGIRFKKLMAIANEIAGTESYNLYGGSGKRSHCECAGEKWEYYILLNFLFNKTEDDIIKALSHEITHIKLNSNEHNEDFQKKWNELYIEFCEKMKGGKECA